MELRLHDARDRWRNQEQSVPLRIESEMPFSLEALHAMRVGYPMSTETATRATSVPPNDGHTKQQRRAAFDPDKPCDRAFRCGQWVLLLLTICSVLVVVTLMSMAFVKVGQVLTTVNGSGSGMQAKVDRVLDHAMEAALHTATATANAAEMSVLAKNAVQEVHPRLIDALNQTSDMMDDLRDFSLHPQLTVSAGGIGSTRRRRRD